MDAIKRQVGTKGKGTAVHRVELVKDGKASSVCGLDLNIIHDEGDGWYVTCIRCKSFPR